MGTAADSRTTVPGPHPPLTLFLLLRCFLLGFFLGCHDELLWVVVNEKQRPLGLCSTARGAGVKAASRLYRRFGNGGDRGTETQFGDYHRQRCITVAMMARALVGRIVIRCTSQSIQNLHLPRLVFFIAAPISIHSARRRLPCLRFKQSLAYLPCVSRH